MPILRCAAAVALQSHRQQYSHTARTSCPPAWFIYSFSCFVSKIDVLPTICGKAIRTLPTKANPESHDVKCTEEMYHSDHGVDFPDLSFPIPGSPAELGPANTE
ncbi:hypothetical protein PFLUV_G00074940 [Perca fluviatilis]|uniref:Uncharacterized protein n=1 Tax=Perca fluviatilis TaxID=8168 RepID=A0A6A5FF12_PERFL|nr:hypothetical protein PFLUV_G00074940 [Perca fluviatilis]